LQKKYNVSWCRIARIFGLNNTLESKGIFLAKEDISAAHYAVAESLYGPHNGRKVKQSEAGMGHFGGQVCGAL